MSNDEMYRRIEHQLDFQKDTIRSYLEATIDVVGEQNKNINEHKEWLSDIANRLEATLANEKENQALKERIEELKERVEELEKENRRFERHLKISRETIDNLIEFLIKGD